MLRVVNKLDSTTNPKKTPLEKPKKGKKINKKAI
jgi:hypothetical protein